MAAVVHGEGAGTWDAWDEAMEAAAWAAKDDRGCGSPLVLAADAMRDRFPDRGDLDRKRRGLRC